MTAVEVVAAIKRHHDGREWTVFEEMRFATGWSKDADREADIWAINVWPSRNLVRVAYEVKVSRSDWLRELKQPYKRASAVRWSNEFWIATPPGIVATAELPEKCGLVEFSPTTVNGRYNRRVVVQAPSRQTPEPTWGLVAALARRVARGEQERLLLDAAAEEGGR